MMNWTFGTSNSLSGIPSADHSIFEGMSGAETAQRPTFLHVKVGGFRRTVPMEGLGRVSSEL